MTNPIHEQTIEMNSWRQTDSLEFLSHYAFENSAQQIAEKLVEEIKKYQNKLDETHDVALSIVSFNKSIIIKVESVGCVGNTMISFHGKDINNNPLELIQHISQLNFYLMPYPKPVETPVDQPVHRKIGFLADL